MDKTKGVETLSFGEQASVIMIELLLRVVEGKLPVVAVEKTLGDLMQALPFPVSTSSVNHFADRVAEYGIQELPAYEAVTNGPEGS